MFTPQGRTQHFCGVPRAGVTALSEVDDWDLHWEEYARAAERNPAQRYRRRLALKLLEAEGAPVRLLDIGSGQGDFLEAASRRWPGAALMGLEASARGNAIARAKVPGATILEADLVAAHNPEHAHVAWATHALCSEVLEHVDEPVALLRNARRYLEPGAGVLVTVPGGAMSAFDNHIGHRRHYTPRTLAETFATAGLDTELTTGAGYPFFNLYRRVVIARGASLVEEAASRHGSPGLMARSAMAAFTPLLGMSLTRSTRGMQIIGVAREPR